MGFVLDNVNEPTGLEKFGSALFGAGQGLQGIAQAQQLQQLLQQKDEEHKAQMSAAAQTVALYKQKLDQNAQTFSWEQQQHEQDQSGVQAMQGFKGSAFSDPMKRLEGALEIAKSAPNAPGMKQFVEMEAKQAKQASVSASIDKLRGSLEQWGQPTATGQEPVLPPEVLKTVMQHVETLRGRAETDPDGAANDVDQLQKSLDANAMTVAKQRAQFEDRGKVLMQASAAIDALAPGADPNNISLARKLLQATDAKGLNDAQLHEAVKSATMAAHGMLPQQIQAQRQKDQSTQAAQNEADKQQPKPASPDEMYLDARKAALEEYKATKTPFKAPPPFDPKAIDRRAEEIHAERQRVAHPEEKPSAIPGMQKPSKRKVTAGGIVPKAEFGASATPARFDATPQPVTTGGGGGDVSQDSQHRGAVSEPAAASSKDAEGEAILKSLGIDPSTPVDKLTPEQVAQIQAAKKKKGRKGIPVKLPSEQRGGGPF